MSQYLDISLQQDQPNLSATQKKFNQLLKKLDQQKNLLAEWQHAQQDIQHQAAKELLPAYAQLHQLYFQQLEMLWQHKLKNKLTKRYKEILDDRIAHISAQLMRVNTLTELQCDEVSRIFHYFQPDSSASTENNSNTDVPEFAEEMIINLQKEMIKKMVCQEMGVDVTVVDFDFDVEDIDGLVAKINEKIEQEFLQSLDEAEQISIEKQMQRERAKEQKKLEKQEYAKKMANQSLKSIYSKIAAAIHPDRELDEVKKVEKTEIFQMTNQAYEKKDLFTLLKLQQYIDKDVSTAQKSYADEQLKFYNTELETQIEELDIEIEEIIDSFDWGNHIALFSSRKIKTKDLYKKYKTDLKNVQESIQHSEFIVKHLQDPTNLKSLLLDAYF